MAFVDVRRLYSDSYPSDILGPQLPPTLASLAPSSIVVNTSTPVTITGSGFNHNATVLVDGVSQLTSWISATEVRYTALADAVGTQDVRVRNGSSVPSALLTLTVTATVLGQTTPEPEPEPEPEPKSKPEPEPEPES